MVRARVDPGRRRPALPEADGGEPDEAEPGQGQHQRHHQEPLVAAGAGERPARGPRGGHVGEEGHEPPPARAKEDQGQREQLRERGDRGDHEATPPERSRTASTRAENSRSRSSSS